MFNDNYKNRPKITPEVGGGKVLVETAGYIPAKKKIQELIASGQRLVDYRKSVYDSDVTPDDLQIDPMRRKGIDLAEVSDLKKRSERNIEASIKAYNEAQRDLKTKPKVEVTPDALNGALDPK